MQNISMENSRLDYIKDIVVLLFFALFFLPVPVLFMSFANPQSFIIFFVFGICVGYVSVKGQNEGIVRRSAIVGSVVAASSLAFSLVLAKFYMNFAQVMANIILSNQMKDSSFFMVPWALPSEIDMVASCVFLAITMLSGSIVYPLLIQKLSKKKR
jgi:hypothetical protein